MNHIDPKSYAVFVRGMPQGRANMTRMEAKRYALNMAKGANHLFHAVIIASGSKHSTVEMQCYAQWDLDGNNQPIHVRWLCQ